MNQDLIQNFDMHITKASLDDKNVMRWAAVNSDTDKDSYQERMSLDLYEDFDRYIRGEQELAKEFRSLVFSDYWQGGMPYVSISHYPDLNGKAVPGKPVEVFVDGNRLKAKGILFDSPLGHKVYRSLKDDKYKNTEEKIRISIGFLDLAHKHGDGGNTWVRQSAYDLCPECLEGVGDKVYLKGCLIHLALTRVPVNKRTEMVLEEKSMAKRTRKEDAESIVGKDVAEEIEAINKLSTQKSDILIEMSDAEETDVEEETEEVSKPAPVATIDVEKLMKDENVKTPSNDVENTSSTPQVLASTTDPRGYKETEKSTEKSMDEPMMNDHLPYGGATSMKDAQDYVEAKNEAMYLMDMWSVFSNVVWNIMDRSDVENKRSVLKQAVDEFKSVLTAKAMVAFSQTESNFSVSVKGELTETESHPLQSALDILLNAVDNSLTLELDVNGRLQYVNPSLQELGTAISEFVKTKSVIEPTAPDKNDDILDEMKNILHPIAEGIKSLSERVGMIEAKSQAQTVETKSRIPQPKTLRSSVIQSQITEMPAPTSLKAIVRKSVGLNQ